MNQKSFLVLSGVTVAALAVAALALRGKDAPAAAGTRPLLFPELSEHLNELVEVRLEKAGKSATLRREGGQWRLADRGGYPAKFEEVKELVVRVADLEIVEEKTGKKENHAKLGVQWPPPVNEGEEGAEADAEASEAGLVTLRDAGGKELASLVVGKSQWTGSKPKVYVRRAGEDRVYFCEPHGSLDVAPEPRNWIETKFVELANDRVQNVTIEHADGEQVEIGRSAANHTQFAVQNLPPGKDEKYAGVANGVAQALGYGLSLEDVRPVTEVDFAAAPVAKTRYRCVDGLELLVETAKFEDKTWVKVSAGFTPPPEPPAPPAPEASEEPASGEPAEGSGEGAAGEPAAEAAPAEPSAQPEKKDIAKEAAELNERLAPWAFEVGSYRTDQLARRMKDLLAEPPAPVEDGGLEGALDEMGVSTDEESVEPLPPRDDEEGDDEGQDEPEAPSAPPPDDGAEKPE